MDNAEWGLLAEVARRFYVEDEAKTEIAQALGMSRFRVARALERARNEGVVRIEIHEPLSIDASLSRSLAQGLGLKECVVLRRLEGVAINDEHARERLAKVAADYVRKRLGAGDVLGVAWGRTTAKIGEYLRDLPKCVVVQMTGVVGNSIRESPVEIMRSIAANSDVESVVLTAPIFASSELAQAAITDDPFVSQAMSYFDRLSVALLPVGAWKPRISQLERLLTDEEKREIERSGAIAEMAGIFFDAEGQVIDLSLNERRISVSPGQLECTPLSVAVAGGSDKLAAIRAVAKSDLVSVLITDANTAEQIMALT